VTVPQPPFITRAFLRLITVATPPVYGVVGFIVAEHFLLHAGVPGGRVGFARSSRSTLDR
jgi:hypothetical protein